MQELRAYKNSLRPEDRALFEDILERAFLHYGSIGHASSFHAWAFLLLSIIMEQEKVIRNVVDRRVQHP